MKTNWRETKEKVRSQAWAQAWNQVGDRWAGYQVWGTIKDQVWDKVRNQVWDQVRGQVWDQVRGQVWDQITHGE